MRLWPHWLKDVVEQHKFFKLELEFEQQLGAAEEEASELQGLFCFVGCGGSPLVCRAQRKKPNDRQRRQRRRAAAEALESMKKEGPEEGGERANEKDEKEKEGQPGLGLSRFLGRQGVGINLGCTGFRESPKSLNPLPYISQERCLPPPTPTPVFLYKLHC